MQLQVWLDDESSIRFETAALLNKFLQALAQGCCRHCHSNFSRFTSVEIERPTTIARLDEASAILCNEAYLAAPGINRTPQGGAFLLRPFQMPPSLLLPA